MSYTGEYGVRFRKKWLGTNISRWEYARQHTMTDLRNPSHKKTGSRIKDGGWHFTYIGSSDQESVTERIKRKIVSAAHQELNTDEILGQIESNIQNLNDLFGRRRTKFKVLEQFDYLPAYVQQNIAHYEYLIRK
jgi:beta-1,4-mannosyl-glycoprotein beta-1,4-N-acetylglucosaminyltransferase